jgi:hypothetical protein
MQGISLQRLFHEWMALIAILAMLLGPLALGVYRSLATQDRIVIAAGLNSLPLCQPGGELDGASGAHTLSSCDHCLPGMAGPLPVMPISHSHWHVAMTRFNVIDVAAALRAATGLPPATGPPIS